MTWSQFLRAHRDVFAAADFFTVEVWGPSADQNIAAKQRAPGILDPVQFSFVGLVL